MEWKTCSWHIVPSPGLSLRVSEGAGLPLLARAGAVAAVPGRCTGQRGRECVPCKESGSCFLLQRKHMPTGEQASLELFVSLGSAAFFRVTATVKACVANDSSFLLRSELPPVARYSSWWPALETRPQSSSLSCELLIIHVVMSLIGKKASR